MNQPILTTHQNEILEAIRAVALDPADFEWTERRSFWSQRQAPRLAHKPTGYYFMVDFGAIGVAVEYSPADDRPKTSYTLDGWAQVRLLVDRWLNSLVREHTAPDLWAELTRRREMLAGDADEAENRPFEPGELERVDAALAEVRELVQATYDLTQGQQEQLDRRLAYLEAAARRVGRVDWLNLVLAAIVQLIFQGVLSSDAGEELTSFIHRSLGDLFEFLRGLPLSSA